MTHRLTQQLHSVLERVYQLGLKTQKRLRIIHNCRGLDRIEISTLGILGCIDSIEMDSDEY